MLANRPDLIRAELNPGEQVIGSGQPQPSWMLRPAEVIQIPFSWRWGGFANFGECSGGNHA